MEEKKFLNMDELAEYIHLSKSFIYKRVCYKTIPFVKLGTRTVFVKEQIDQWVINGGQMMLNSLLCQSYKIKIINGEVHHPVRSTKKVTRWIV